LKDITFEMSQGEGNDVFVWRQAFPGIWEEEFGIGMEEGRWRAIKKGLEAPCSIPEFRCFS
jgi:hypothetical protein